MNDNIWDWAKNNTFKNKSEIEKRLIDEYNENNVGISEEMSKQQKLTILRAKLKIAKTLADKKRIMAQITAVIKE